MDSLREDRFSCSIPFVSQEEFYNSSFLELYNKTVQHPDMETVINSLCDLPDRSCKCEQVMEDIRSAPKDYDVIRVYTSDVEVGSKTFYNYINEQLHNDNKETLRHLMPLIRRGTYQINRHPPSSKCITYRGMRLNSDQRAYFQVGTIFRFPGFTSTSMSESQAKKFGNTLFEIHIYSGCLQVRDVSDISHCPNEQEYLFSPYSLFEVTNINNRRITLRAIDNMENIGMNSTNPVPTYKPVAHPTPSNTHASNKPTSESSTKPLPKKKKLSSPRKKKISKK